MIRSGLKIADSYFTVYDIDDEKLEPMKEVKAQPEARPPLTLRFFLVLGSK